ncbi:MAG: hypothetical protein IH945_07755, partial [Armatimonadetes bacterium]|nr:hypothetical protein [Armatimonadota bacterium]
MTIGYARKGCIAAAVLATVAGCGSGSSISAPGDTWSVASDVTNGGWEIELLTSDEDLQKSFEESRGFFGHVPGSPVVWMKKVDGREDYEPILWLMDSASNRIPLQYSRYSSGGSTYLGVALTPAPSKSQTARGLELQIRDEIVAYWQLDAAGYEPPRSWPSVSQIGAEVKMGGISFKLVPVQFLNPAGETSASVWTSAETVDGIEGAEPEFKYELRYSIWTGDDTAVRTIDLAEPPGLPRDDQVAVGEFEADAFCRLMKYAEAPFQEDFELNELLILGSLEELEAYDHTPLRIQFGDGSIEIYGVYVDEDASGPQTPAAWLKVRAADSLGLDQDAQYDAGWVMLLVEGTSLGDKVEQYKLDDGSTMLVFN